MKKETYDEDEKLQGHRVALCVGLFFLVVGVPVWWRTTSTYRAPLPFDDIDLLTRTGLFVQVPIRVVNLVPTLSRQDLEAATGSLVVAPNIKETRKTRNQVKISYDFAPLKMATISQTADLNLLAAKVFAEMAPQELAIVVVPPTVTKTTKWKGNLMFTPFVSVVSLTEGLDKGLSEGLASTDGLAAVFREADEAKEPMIVGPSASYDITLTLAVSDPGVTDVEFDFKKALRFWQRDLDRIGKHVQINVKSQVLYYVDLEKGIAGYDAANQEYFFSTAKLHYLRNRLETRLSSHVSTNPELNFVVYVPKKPVVLRDVSGEKTDIQAFLSPRWGSILLISPDRGNSTAKVSVDEEMVMRLFASNLLRLLGIKTTEGHVTEANMSAWLMYRTTQYLAQIRRTLSSLVALVSQVRNMVIKEEIAAQVHQSVDAGLRAIESLKIGKLADAFAHAKHSLVHSEEAFFDPTLLGLLYFPQDQKFAIYIPLFVPVGIPVLMSLIKAVKFFKARSSSETEAEEEKKTQ